MKTNLIVELLLSNILNTGTAHHLTLQGYMGMKAGQGQQGAGSGRLVTGREAQPIKVLSQSPRAHIIVPLCCTQIQLGASGGGMKLINYVGN